MITAKNLIKDYGAFRAVNDVSFEVRQGEILGFLGPNGAGKSTTMKMITGFLTPTSGSAAICGHDIGREGVAAKARLGYLPESGPLYPEMTVLEFLQFAAQIRGLQGAAARDAIDRVLGFCHLEGVRHQTIETLSKGFRQRVGMAQAVIHDPTCLVLDEPTDGLDPNQKQEVRALIRSMARDKAILLSTHILEEVDAMCTRVVIIDRGVMRVDESPAALRRRHPNAAALRLALAGDPAPVRQAIAALPGVGRVEAAEQALHIFPRAGEDLRPLLWDTARRQNWNVTALEPLPVRLDEVFRELTRKQTS